MDFSDVKRSEITYKEFFAKDLHSMAFVVEIRSILCLMKVHGDGDEQFIQSYINEVTAYKRLKEQGLCDKGIILQPYGFVEGIDLQQFHPDLDKFLRNYGGPHVIFTEYIPSMRRIDPELYTEKRMKNLVSGLREIHQASVVKSFLSRRDMFIIEDDPERVVWVHFHHAKTYDLNDPAADVKIRWEDMKISRLAGTMEHYNVYGVLGDHWFHLDYM